MKSRKSDLLERFKTKESSLYGLLEPIERQDREFMEKFIGWSTYIYKKGHLDRKTIELVIIALDASTTHLYAPGLREHIKCALRYGATKEEIIEVMELASLVGIHSLTLGVPILEEEIRRFKSKQRVSKR